MTYKKPAKPIKIKFMPMLTSQPMTVHQYVVHHLQDQGNYSLVMMFARLLTVLVSRGFLHAAELRYIVTGNFVPNVYYADWSPEQELEDGLPIPIIRSK